MDEIIARDTPEFVSKVSDLNRQLNEVAAHVSALSDKVKKGEFATEGGLSFLETKFHLLLQYVINLLYVILLKADGRNIEDASVVERLVEIRTVLEKVRPIDKKIKYQVEKLLKLATSDMSNTDKHPLSFKPNIDMLTNQENKEDDTDQSDSGEEGSNEVYVPPRVSAVPYDDESKHAERQRKNMTSQKHALNSSLLKELRSEYSEEPEEIRDDYRNGKMAKFRDKELEREKFEEDNLRRLQLSKKDRQAKRKMNELAEIANMGSFTSFGDDDSDEEDSQTKNKRLRKGFKKGGGKNFKKRIFKKKR